MEKSTALSLFRTLLTLVGSYIVGHNLIGPAVDANILETIGAGIVALASSIWGVMDKSANIEGVQSAVRSLVTSVGGVLVAAGKLSGNTLDAILSLSVALIPALQSHIGKLKTKALDSGQLSTTAAGKVETTFPKIK